MDNGAYCSMRQDPFAMKLLIKTPKYLLFCLIAFVILVPAINALPSYASPEQAVLATAQLRFGNFAPFNEGDAAIRLTIDDNGIVGNFNYGWSTGYTDIEEGVDLVVQVYEATGAESLLKIDTITLEAGKKYTLIFIGNGSNPLTDQVFDLVLIDDDVIAAESDSAAIAFGHFAPLSPNSTGTSIDIRQDNDILIRDNLVYGQFNPADIDQLTKTTTSYLITSASGAYEFIDIQTFGYNLGDVQYLLVVGDGRNKPIRAYMYVNEGTGGFMTTDSDTTVVKDPAIAFANFYSDPDVESVQFDFGATQLSLLEWGQLSPSQSYPVGDYDIDVFDSTRREILSEKVAIGLSETVIYVITKNNTNGDPLLVPVFGDYLEVRTGTPRIRFVHLAPFASGSAATLDVRRTNGLLVEDDLEFAETGAFRSLAVGEYSFNFTNRTGDRVLFDLDPITLQDGDNVTVFLTGDGVSQPIQTVIHSDNVATLSDQKWDLPTGKYSLTHVAPTGTGNATNTRVEIDSIPVATGFGYGDFRPAEFVALGQHQVSVYDEATNTMLTSATINISALTIHAIVLTGDNVNKPYEIVVYEYVDHEPVSDPEAILRFGNLAVISDSSPEFDGSSVKLVAQNNELFSSLAYGDLAYGTPSAMQPAMYEFTYLDANKKEIPENVFEFSLMAQDNYIFFSVGDGNRQPYGFFAMEADGSSGKLLKDIENDTTFIYLPIVLRAGN
ncbi:MAG: hypothetical protein ACI85U_003044 [Candidatus Promineifilaceae bacterium]|jgi:hypothetical protein